MKITSDRFLDLAGAIVFANLTYHLDSGHLFHSLIEPFEKTGAAIFGGVATNHVGNLLKSSDINRRLFRKDPYHINGDLERIFRESCVLSIDFMEQICTKELRQDLYKGDIKTWYAWQKFKGKLRTHFQVYKELTKSYINKQNITYDNIEHPDAELADITQHLFAIFPLEMETEQVDKIKEIFTNQLPNCLDLAFKDAIKHDEQGFKAFQIWMLQHISERQGMLTKEILKAIEKVQSGIDVFSREDFEILLDEKAEEIYTRMEFFFSGIKDQFKALSEQYKRDHLFLRRQNFRIMAQAEKTHEIVEQTQQTLNKFEQNNRQNFVSPHFLTNPKNFMGEIVGRDEDLDKLQKMLESAEHPVLIFGLGGLGKSTLAKVFVKKFHKNYDHVAWIEIDNNSNIRVHDSRMALINAFTNHPNFNSINNTLNLRVDKEVDKVDFLNQILLTLKNIPGKNLLVIDNIAAPILEFLEYLPFPPDWQVLTTGRELVNGFDRFDLEELSNSIAVGLFQSIYAHAKQQTIKDLFALVGRNTLMIELMAKTLACNPALNPESLLEELHNRTLDQASLNLQTVSTAHNKYEAQIYNYLLSTFNLSGLSDNDKSILKMLYFIPSKGLVLEEIYSWFNITDIHQFKISLINLEKKGWVINEGEVFRLHGLIEQLVYYQLRPGPKQSISVINYFSESLMNSFQVEESIIFVSQTEKFLSKIDEEYLNSEEIALLYTNLGDVYDDLSQLSKAQSVFLKSKIIFERLCKDVSPLYADSLMLPMFGLGRTAMASGKNGEAKAYYQQVVELSDKSGRKLSSPAHQCLCISINLLATIDLKEFQYQSALSKHKLSMKLSGELDMLDRRNLDLKANLCINGTLIYRALNESVLAVQSSDEALVYLEQLLKMDSDRYMVRMIKSLTISGHTQMEAGDYVLAKSLFQRAKNLVIPLVKLFSEIFSTIFVDVLEGEADYYYHMQLADNAAKIYLKGISLIEKLQLAGKLNNKMDLASLYANYARSLNKADKNAEALNYYTASFDIFDTLSIEEQFYHTRWLVHTKTNMANAYRSTGSYKLAKEIYLEVEKYLLDFNQGESETYALLCNSFGLLYKDQKKYKQAEAKLLNSLKIRNALAEKTPNVFLDLISDVHNNLGVVYVLMDNRVKSKFHFEQCYEMRSLLYKINPNVFAPKLARICLTLGSMLTKLEPAKAEEMFKESLKSFKESEKSVATYDDQIIYIYKALAELSLDREPNKDPIEIYEESIIYRSRLLDLTQRENLELLEIYLTLINHYADHQIKALTDKHFHNAQVLVKIIVPEDANQELLLATFKFKIGLHLKEQMNGQAALEYLIEALNHYINVLETASEIANLTAIIFTNLTCAECYWMLSQKSPYLRHLVEGSVILEMAKPFDNEAFYKNYINELCKGMPISPETFYEEYVGPEIQRRMDLMQ